MIVSSRSCDVFLYSSIISMADFFTKHQDTLNHVTKWIIAHEKLPIVDYWNTYGAGKHWRPYSWSLEVLFAFVDEHYGIIGLLALKWGFAALLAGGLMLAMSIIAGDYFIGSFFGALASVACYLNFALRPQSLSWLFFVGIIACVDLVRRNGFKVKYLFFSFLLMCFWANTNISAILGLGIGFLWFLNEKRFFSSIKEAIFFVGIVFLGTLFTPHFGAEWLTFFNKVDHPITYSFINEMETLPIISLAWLIYLVPAVLLLSFFISKKTNLRLGVFVCLVMFSVLGLAFRKFFPHSSIVLCCVLSTFWHDFAAEVNTGTLGLLKLSKKKFCSMSVKQFFAVSVLLFVISGLNILHLAARPAIDPIIPVDELDFIVKHKLPGPILNEFDTGGYIAYRYLNEDGTTKMQVPIDGRTNVSTPKIMAMYEDAVAGNYNWKQYLQTVRPNTVLWRIGFPLPWLLLETGKWCIVYGDPKDKSPGYKGAVLVRKEALKASVKLNTLKCMR